MQTRLLHEDNGQRTFAVVLETGEEVLTCLQRFVSREHVLAAQITAIGALSDVVLMYFDWDKNDYRKIPVREQVEVASLIGDVAEAPTGEPALHLHLVVGKRDGSAMAGHLGEAMFARPLKSSLPKVRRTCARSKTRNRDWRSSGLQRDQAHRLNSHTASGTI